MIEEYYIQLAKNAIKEEVEENLRSLKLLAKFRNIEFDWVIEEYRNQFNRQARGVIR